MLNYLEVCKDKEFCDKLRVYLFWFDLASLGTDAILKKMLQKSAKEALDTMPEDITKQHPEIKAHLNEISRSNAKLTPEFNVIPPKILKAWVNYLKVRGVKFEIGTKKAITILQEEKALGIFEWRIINPEINQIKRTIYLYDNPAASTFLEECYHAVQSLNKVPRILEQITYKGKSYYKINNWEYLAKKRILDEAQKNGINYEEYIFIENQLLEVLENKY